MELLVLSVITKVIIIVCIHDCNLILQIISLFEQFHVVVIV